MKERPILFSAPMVRAILNGRKTQTRRVVKPGRDPHVGCQMAPCEIAGDINNGNFAIAPYGQPGDRLWVRETWAPCGRNSAGVGPDFLYRADLASGSYYPAVERWNHNPFRKSGCSPAPARLSAFCRGTICLHFVQLLRRSRVFSARIFPQRGCMTFIRNGLTLTERMAPPNSCAGCHFDGPDCTHDMQPPCMAGHRADRTDVIFVVAPALDAHLQDELPL